MQRCRHNSSAIGNCAACEYDSGRLIRDIRRKIAGQDELEAAFE
jgi:hypothetical protein